MTTTTATMKDPHREIYKAYGLSEGDWISLAKIWHKVQPYGIEAKCILPLSAKDQKLGIEVLFQRGTFAYSLRLSSKTRELWLSFYRNQDRAPEMVVQGHIDRWQEMAGRMLCLR